MCKLRLLHSQVMLLLLSPLRSGLIFLPSLNLRKESTSKFMNLSHVTNSSEKENLSFCFDHILCSLLFCIPGLNCSLTIFVGILPTVTPQSHPRMLTMGGVSPRVSSCLRTSASACLPWCAPSAMATSLTRP